MRTFAFNPAPEWPAFAADWVPELGWTPPEAWVTPEGWQVWTVVAVLAPKTSRPRFGSRKPADDLAASIGLAPQLEEQLAAALERETQFLAEIAEYKVVRRGLEKIGALESLDLLLELNVIGARMQESIADLEAYEVRERGEVEARLNLLRAQLVGADVVIDNLHEVEADVEEDVVPEIAEADDVIVEAEEAIVEAEANAEESELNAVASETADDVEEAEVTSETAEEKTEIEAVSR